MENNNTSQNTRYEVVDSKTQIVVGTYSTMRRAYNAADKQDNIYGAVRYFVRRAS